MKIRPQITTSQKLFLQSKKRAVIYRGGLGAGKTRILCTKAITDALNGLRWCVLGETYVILRDVIIFTLEEILQEWGIDYMHNKADSEILVKGGKYPILLRSWDKPDRLRGPNLDAFGMDEARNCRDDSVWQVMIGRIRRTENGQGFITTTPNGKDWVYNLKQKMGDKCDLFVQSTMDNPFLPKSYVQDLIDQYGDTFARQELYADIIDLSAGLFKQEWVKWCSMSDLPKLGQKASYYDLAYSENEKADRTCGGNVMRSTDGRYYYWGNISARKQWPQMRAEIIKRANRYNDIKRIGVDASMSQVGFFNDLQSSKELSQFTIEAKRHSTNKIQNAMPFISRCESGLVYVVDTPEARDQVEEMASFSENCLHDDAMDFFSGAYDMVGKSVGASFAPAF